MIMKSGNPPPQSHSPDPPGGQSTCLGHPGRCLAAVQDFDGRVNGLNLNGERGQP